MAYPCTKGLAGKTERVFLNFNHYAVCEDWGVARMIRNIKHTDLIVILTLLCFKGNVWGQAVLRGIVRDTSGEAVPMATITVSSCSEERVLGYTYADAEGRYQLSFDVSKGCDTLVFTVRALGFQSQTVVMWAHALPETYHFTLASRQLQEVVVRARYAPVVRKGDTTEYRLASFSDSTEVNIEELLRKLPGFEVSDNGLLYVRGKLVERVMIEGDDLFSYNYSLATRNLRADMFSTAQLIEGYQENPLLKDLMSSERLALNLTVREDRKLHWSGTATGGLGAGGYARYHAHLNLFTIGKQEKIYFIGRADNAGKTSIGDLTGTSIVNPFDARQSIQQSTMHMRPLQLESVPTTMGMPRSFTLHNRTATGYYGHVLPMGPLKMKMAAWAGVERLEQNAYSDSRFLLESTELLLTERTTTQWKRQTYHFHTEGDYYSIDLKRSLRFFARVDAEPRQQRQQATRQEAQLPSFEIAEHQQVKPFASYLAAEYTHKTSQKSLIQITIRQDYRRHNYLLNGQNDYYSLFFGIDERFRKLVQQSEQTQQKTHFSAQFVSNHSAFEWMAEVGAYWNGCWLNTTMILQDTTGSSTWQPTPDAPYAEAFGMWKNRYYTQVQARYKRERFNLTTRLLGGWQIVNFLEKPQKEQILTLWQPQILTSYQAGLRSTITAMYTSQPRMPDVTQLYPGYRFITAGALIQGLTDPNWIVSHQASLRYQWKNDPKMSSWSLSLSWFHTDNQLGVSHIVNPFLQIRDLFRPVTHTNYSGTGSMERYFSNISSRLQLSFGYHFTQEPMRVNSELQRNINTHTTQAQFSYGTAFDGWFNFFLNAHALRSVSDNFTSSTLRGRVSSQSWMSSADVVIKPSNVFRMKFTLTNISTRTSEQPYNALIAVNGEVFLRLPKWRSDAYLLLNNLLGTHRFENVFTSAFYESRSGLVTTPRFALLSWAYTF